MAWAAVCVRVQVCVRRNLSVCRCALCLSTFPFSGVGAWPCAFVYLGGFSLLYTCVLPACMCKCLRECVFVSVWLCEGACVCLCTSVYLPECLCLYGHGHVYWHECVCSHVSGLRTVDSFAPQSTARVSSLLRFLLIPDICVPLPQLP